MRPIAVLILVVGAVAALIFAFLSISSDAGREGSIKNPVVREVDTPSLTPQDNLVSDGGLGNRNALDVPENDQRTEITEAGATGSWPNELKGVVLSPERTVVADAKVQLHEHSGTTEIVSIVAILNDEEPRKPHRETKTNAAGEFSFSNLSPNKDWSLIVLHKDYSRTQVGPIDMPQEGAQTEDVQMKRGFEILGYVNDESGTPIPDATLELDHTMSVLLPNKKRKSQSRMTTTSDASGFFRFGNVAPGQQRTLVCSAKGYGTQLHTNIHFMGQESRTMEKNVVLKPGMLIAGRVVKPDMSGLKDIKVEAISHNSGISSRGFATTKADGEFVVEDITEGVYTVRAYVEEWDVDPKAGVEAGDTNVLIQVYEQGSVIGRVVDAETGKAIKNFQVKIRTTHPTNPAYGRIESKGGFRDAKDGGFKLGNISQGSYVAEGVAEGYASSFSERFSIQQGLTTPDVVIRLGKGGTITGTVVDSYTNSPVAGAVVSTFENNWVDSEFLEVFGGLQPTALTRITTKTDKNGRFEIKLMTPAVYQVRVEQSGYTSEMTNDVRVGDGLDYELPTVRLSRGATVRGTVYGADGRQAKGMDVFIRPTDGKFGRNLQTRSDANGRFVLTNVAAGDYKLSAARPASATSNPFEPVVDMKNSETPISVQDGQEYTNDLYLGKN